MVVRYREASRDGWCSGEANAQVLATGLWSRDRRRDHHVRRPRCARTRPATRPHPQPLERHRRRQRFRPFRFRFGVRGFVRSPERRSDGVQEDDVDLTFLRPEIRWEPSEAIRGVFEIDLAGDPRITDAFVRVRSDAGRRPRRPVQATLLRSGDGLAMGDPDRRPRGC